MRRMLLLCAILAVGGCAKKEPPASESTPAEQPAVAAISLADVVGTWDGTITAADNDSVLVNIRLTATADASGWTMKVANAKTPANAVTVPATSVVADGDSVIVEAGPFASVLRPGQQVTTHTVYRLGNGMLMGTIVASYPASGQTVMLRSVATRTPAQ